MTTAINNIDITAVSPIARVNPASPIVTLNPLLPSIRLNLMSSLPGLQYVKACKINAEPDRVESYFGKYTCRITKYYYLPDSSFVALTEKHNKDGSISYKAELREKTGNFFETPILID